MRLRGQLKRNGFQVRSYDLNGVAATADFAPVYPASEEVTPQRLRGARRAGAAAARDLPDPLPAELKAAERLPLRADALWALHRPRSLEEGEDGQAAARVRRAARAPGRARAGARRAARRRSRRRSASRASWSPATASCCRSS